MGDILAKTAICYTLLYGGTFIAGKAVDYFSRVPIQTEVRNSGTNTVPVEYVGSLNHMTPAERANYYVHKLKPNSLELGRNLQILILDHPKNPTNKPHTLVCGKREGFFDSGFEQVIIDLNNTNLNKNVHN